jgi:hypothetical protein
VRLQEPAQDSPLAIGAFGPLEHFSSGGPSLGSGSVTGSIGEHSDRVEVRSIREFLEIPHQAGDHALLVVSRNNNPKEPLPCPRCGLTGSWPASEGDGQVVNNEGDQK